MESMMITDIDTCNKLSNLGDRIIDLESKLNWIIDRLTKSTINTNNVSECPFTKGQAVLVRDTIREGWRARIFYSYTPDNDYPYAVCHSADTEEEDCCINYKYCRDFDMNVFLDPNPKAE